MAQQILFIQGGGAGAHDDWDQHLVNSLVSHLDDGYEVRYPRMPDEHDPAYATWSAAIRHELASMNDDPIVIGHSLGAPILIAALAKQDRPQPQPAAIVLIAAPFVGEGGWPGAEFTLTGDLGARLPEQVMVFHGLEDQTAPAAHAHLYAQAIAQAQVHLLPGRDHQLNNDLSEVAEALRKKPC